MYIICNVLYIICDLSYNNNNFDIFCYLIEETHFLDYFGIRTRCFTF